MSKLIIKDAGLKFAGPLVPVAHARIKHVVVHHSANANPKWGVKECHTWHRNGNGWIGIGYNYFIEQSGDVYLGRSESDRDFVGAHVAGWNSRAIGICLDGNYSVQIPTDENLEKLAQLCGLMCIRYRLPVSALRYHTELQRKDCPGKLFPPRHEFAERVRRWVL